jgi:hypothetical protein
MNPESSKRQRLTPVPGEQNAPLDGKHVSETVLNSSGEKPFPKASEAEEIIAKTDALDNQQESQISSLLTKVTKSPVSNSTYYTNSIKDQRSRRPNPKQRIR